MHCYLCPHEAWQVNSVLAFNFTFKGGNSSILSVTHKDMGQLTKIHEKNSARKEQKMKKVSREKQPSVYIYIYIYIYTHILFFHKDALFILLSRESDQSAIRARLGVASHLSTTPRWGNPAEYLYQRRNKKTCRLVLHTVRLMLSVKQGSCEYQFYSHWFDPTRNQTQVYNSRGERSHHSAIRAIT